MCVLASGYLLLPYVVLGILEYHTNQLLSLRAEVCRYFLCTRRTRRRQGEGRSLTIDGGMNQPASYTARFLDDGTQPQGDAEPDGRAPKGCMVLGKLMCSLKMCIGNLYLVGSLLLLPGFLWIIPETVVTIPLPNKKTITVPKFDHVAYTRGVYVLIAGMGCVLVAAVADLVLVHAGIACTHTTRDVYASNSQRTATSRQPPAKRKPIAIASSITQVLGATALLAGCVVFLPEFSLSKPPRVILSVSAPDLGNYLFQAGSVLYFVGALLAIVGAYLGIRSARRDGRGTAMLWASIAAFLLFICTSSLFFANGLLPTAQAILAGQMRLAASVCLLCAICILYAVTAAEVTGSLAAQRHEDKRNAGYISSGP